MGAIEHVVPLRRNRSGGDILFAYGFHTTYIVLVGIAAVATLLVILFVRPDVGDRSESEERTSAEVYDSS